MTDFDCERRKCPRADVMYFVEISTSVYRMLEDKITYISALNVKLNVSAGSLAPLLNKLVTCQTSLLSTT